MPTLRPPLLLIIVKNLNLYVIFLVSDINKGLSTDCQTVAVGQSRFYFSWEWQTRFFKHNNYKLSKAPYSLITQSYSFSGAVVAVIVWQLDLQLHMQSVPMTTKVMISNPAQGKVYSLRHYVIKFVSDLQQVSGLLRFLPPIKHHNTKPYSYSSTIWTFFL